MADDDVKITGSDVSPRSIGKVSISSASTHDGASSGTCSTLESLHSVPSGSGLLYQFHHANIHEKRFAAYAARAMPMTTLLSILTVSVLGAFRYPYLLYVTAAVFNVWMWVWFVSYALHTLRGIWVARRTVQAAAAAPRTERTFSFQDPVMDVEAPASPIVHLVILPNYKEDESIMATTLESLAQTDGSHDFRVVLAMEEREGPNAKERAERLQARFASCFSSMSTTFHPMDLRQEHLDGSEIPEIPGKSSNLKWAVRMGYEQCEDHSISPSSVVVTVADADCIFHASYFSALGCEYDELRAAPGSQHQWTIWQAPQLPFRNYFASAAPSRIWGYIASSIEFGGVAGLALGGYHMTFSSFSLPLELILKAKPWDGDVIADDHHCYLKCFLYSIHNEACQQMQMEGKCTGVNPSLQVRPIMLPVKTTSVEDKNCQKSWTSRFNQAQRHTQGVAELSYILLGAFDLLRTLPRSAYTCALISKLFRVVLIPFSINMLSICHAIPFAVMALYWMFHGQQVPHCPNELWLQFDRPDFYLCALAGGFNMVVPVMVPMVLVIVANYFMISTFFLQHSKASKSEKVWGQEDGDIPPTCGSRRLSLIGLILLDVVLLLPVVMPIYGFIPNVRSYWNVMVRGNRFKFISAAKGVETQAPVSRCQNHCVQQNECPQSCRAFGQTCDNVKSTA